MMIGAIDRYLETHLFPAQQLSAEAPGWNSVFTWLAANLKSSSGVTVTPETAMRQSTVFACVRVMAETMAQLPRNVYRRASDGRRIDASNHALNSVFSQPNPWQSGFEFVEMMQGHLSLRGNAFAHIVPGTLGAVTELWPWHPDRVQVHRLANMRLRYVVTQPNGKQDDYSQDEVFHLRGLSSDGLLGMSPIHYARDTIGLNLAAENYGGKFFRNSARPSGLLTSDSMQITPEKAKKAQETFMEAYSGEDNWHKPAVLWGGLKWQNLGLDNEDAKFIETLARGDEQICKIFRMPPHMVGILDRATNNNIEQQSLEFVLYTMLPTCKAWEETIQRDLITDDSYFFKFNLRGLLRGDHAARSSFYSTMVNTGLMCPNEVRELEDLDPYEGGDNFFMQGAMVTVDSVVNPPPVPVLPQGPNPDEQKAQQEKAQAAAIEQGKLLGQQQVLKAEIDSLASRLAQRDQDVAEAYQKTAQATAAAEARAAEFAALTERHNVTLGERDAALARSATSEGEKQVAIVAESVAIELRAAAEAELNAAREQAEARKQAINAALVENGRLLGDCLKRMFAMEADAMIRAAKKAKFPAIAESFYGQHRERFLAAIEPIIAQRSTLGATCEPASAFVDAQISESKIRLAEACEGPTDCLATRIVDCVAQWEWRAETIMASTEESKDNAPAQPD